MNVKQALKKKSRLIKELNSTWDIIQRHNSVLDGNKYQYNIADQLDKVDNLIAEIVKLKKRIHRANLPVYDDIFRMSELKNYIKRLGEVNTHSGIVDDKYRNSVPQKYKAQLSDVDKNTLIKHTVDMIDALQDKLDIHNATTEI